MLASASEIREQILLAAGFRVRVRVAEVDEDLHRDLTPEIMAWTLSGLKALEVSRNEPGELVVGSDQVFTLAGEFLPKPKNQHDVEKKLRLLSGRTHVFHCGAALARDGQLIRQGVERVAVTFHELSESEIEACSATGEGVGCAGGYQLEGRGSQLIQHIDGSHFAVLGLPLFTLTTFLRELGCLQDFCKEAQEQ